MVVSDKYLFISSSRRKNYTGEERLVWSSGFPGVAEKFIRRDFVFGKTAGGSTPANNATDSSSSEGVS